MNENIEALKILTNISKNLYTSKKSNYSRIKNNKLFNQGGKEKLINQVINPLDLALLDIMLPIRNGYELAPYFIEKNIPVIFLSAKGETIDKVKGLKILSKKI